MPDMLEDLEKATKECKEAHEAAVQTAQNLEEKRTTLKKLLGLETEGFSYADVEISGTSIHMVSIPTSVLEGIEASGSAAIKTQDYKAILTNLKSVVSIISSVLKETGKKGEN